MKKYFIVFLFLAAIALPAYAAKQVSGEVPQVQPLLPAPQGIAPNVSNNVQFHDSSHDGQFDASGTPIKGGSSQAGIDTNQAEANPVINEGLNQPHEPNIWVLVIIVAVGLLVGLGFWYKNRKGQE